MMQGNLMMQGNQSAVTWRLPLSTCHGTVGCKSQAQAVCSSHVTWAEQEPL